MCAKPIRITYEGESLTFAEIGKILGLRPQSVYDYYRRKGTLEGVGVPARKGKPIPHLEKYYNTLDDSIPLDRAIAAAGFRSIHQFCKHYGISASLLGCWRKGKPYGGGGATSVLGEMVTNAQGLSSTLVCVMRATGCTEWELFPDVFTDAFYRRVYNGAATIPRRRGYEDTAVEGKERRRAIMALLRTLTDKEKIALELYFGLGDTREELTYDEIGRRYDVTRERIRQLVMKGLRKLRHPSRSRLLAEAAPFAVSFTNDGLVAKPIEHSVMAYKAGRHAEW